MKQVILLLIVSMGLVCHAQDTIKPVKIGDQIWMLENLNVSSFRNGDPIPEAKTNEEWANAGKEEKPAWCYYGNDPENGKKYGKLYNWYAVHDRRGLAPEGWHIAEYNEFNRLISFVNNDGNSLKAIGQGTGSGAGTNTSGFSALIAGGRYRKDDTFYNYAASFWTISRNPYYPISVFSLRDIDSSIKWNQSFPKEFGFSVRCLIGDKTFYEAQPDYQALLDTTFNNGSNIVLRNLTNKDYVALSVLGKIWGFLKYYHPMASNGDLNWDYELFRIMPKVLKSNSIEERNKILSVWINSLGAIKEKQEPLNIDKSKVKSLPDLKWTEDESELGKDIPAQLKDIKIAKRDSNNYYLSGQEMAAFENENTYKKMQFPDTGFRLLCLFRYWNMVQYFFPHRNLIGEDWKGVLNEFVPKFIDASNRIEYEFTVLELIARIHDSHAFTNRGDFELEKYVGKNRAPVEIQFIENKAVVTNVYDKEWGEESGLKVGDVILKINGNSIENVVLKELKYTSASNYPTRLRIIAQSILRTNDTLLNIGFTRNGIPEFKEIKTYPKLSYAKYQTPDTCFKLITPDIGYLYLGTLKNEYLPEIICAVQTTKGLILDIRCYPADFPAFILGKYLMPDSTAFLKFGSCSITYPGLFTLTENVLVGEKNKDYYKGKVTILVNEITISRAEYHAMAFRVAPGAKVIGSTTAGSDGGSCLISLPGGITTHFTGLGVYYPDGGETQRAGIIPDIEVKPTIEGIRLGKDEVLEKAIEIINKK